MAEIYQEFDVKHWPMKKGIYGWVDWNNYRIHINNTYNEQLQRYTELHELLHIYYAEKEIPKSEQEIEQETRKLFEY